MSTAQTKAKEPSVDDLTNQIETLKNDIATLTSSVSELAKVEASRVVSVAKQKGQDVRKSGEEHLDALRVTAENYGREAGTYVREQPGTALGIAAALGFFAGLLLSNRR